MFDKLSEDQRQALNIVREGHNLFMTGQGGTARQNSYLLSSIFPVGEGGFGQMMYRSLERSPQNPQGRIFLYNAQASFFWPRVDLARLLRQAYSRSVWIIFFEFVKVCGIPFSICISFIGFYICCYPISTILACLFSVGVRISWKKLCWMRACRRKWHLVFSTLYIIIVDRVNLNKLLQIIKKLRWSNRDNNN